jgi:hypothetical protein
MNETHSVLMSSSIARTAPARFFAGLPQPETIR